MLTSNLFKSIINNKKILPRSPSFSYYGKLNILTRKSFATSNKLSFDSIKFNNINGNTIVSLPTLQSSNMSSITVCIKAGTRFDLYAYPGTSSFFERTFYLSSKNKTSKELIKIMGDLGGDISCNVQRECIFYTLNFPKYQIKLAINLLDEILNKPKFDYIEILKEKQACISDLQQTSQNIPLLMQDFIHMAAYKNTLSNPLIITPKNLEKISSQSLKLFWEDRFTRDNTVFVSRNVDQNYWNELSEFKQSENLRTKDIIYKGGESRLHMDHDKIPRTLFSFAFQSGCWKDYSSYLHSILYNLYLSKNPNFIHVFHNAYSDTGLLGVLALDPKTAFALPNLRCGEIDDVKQTYKSSMESFLSKSEVEPSLGSLLLFADKPTLIDSIDFIKPYFDEKILFENIDKFTKQSMNIFVDELFSGIPTYLAVGKDLKNIPKLTDLYT